MNAPIRVAVTGAAGNIGYALLFRLASGDCYGKDQPLILQLLEITPALSALEGVVMELNDGAFPLLHGVEISDDANVAFRGANQAFLVLDPEQTAPNKWTFKDTRTVLNFVFSGLAERFLDHHRPDEKWF